ncbi:MAG TPA: sensor histidine kinase [Woeseiaceae bacterium]|nr:sensor histidine kinase [Woeseiaceae bacterium]
MSLPDFIENNLERLLAEWQSFAETVPVTAGMSVEDLRDGAEAILRTVAEDLRSPQTKEHRRERSRGNRPGTSPNVTESAQAHAAERLAIGFTLDQLVSEYRALRASVISAWSSSGGGSDREALDDLMLFNEAMDQSLTEAIRWFNSRLERSRNMFVGILGHDLRNPLGAISTYAEIPLVSDDPKSVRDAATGIRRLTNQMRELIDVLLDFSRTRLGKRLPLQRRKTNLALVCKQVAQDFVLSYPKNRIEVNCSGQLNGVWDKARIAQALSNLVKNALDYGKRTGTVTLTCKSKSDEVLLSVHNKGRPIPSAKQRGIFEPLTRGESDDEPRYASKGVGLGLYIVNQIAIAHGGSVELVSNAKDGTTFTVHLPQS